MTTETGTPAAVNTPVRVRPPDEMSVTVQPKNPGEMMVLAIQHGADPAVLQKLIEIQAQWEAMQAKKAYVKAMAAFKAECPAVLKKDAEVDFTSSRGRTHYKHATLGGIVLSITPLLSQNGLSVSFETEQKENRVGVTCHITHELGHRESTKLAGPNDDSGNKNAIQAVGSAVTYLQRYTLLAALGLATAEQDDDGFRADVAAAGRENTAKATDILAKKKAQPAAPAASQQAEPPEDQEQAGASVVTGLVEAVSKKPGKTEGTWRYGFKIGGAWYNSFSDSVAAIAVKGANVEVEFTTNNGFHDITAIRPADAPATGHDALIAEIRKIIDGAPGGVIKRALAELNKSYPGDVAVTAETWPNMEPDAKLAEFKALLIV